MIFEPSDIAKPLARFKYCDSLKMSVGHSMTAKQILAKVMGTKKEKSDEVLENIYLKEEFGNKQNQPEEDLPVAQELQLI